MMKPGASRRASPRRFTSKDGLPSPWPTDCAFHRVLGAHAGRLCDVPEQLGSVSDNIRRTAHIRTHRVMSRWLLLFLAACMIALAGCEARPTATVERPDSTKNATGEVARGTDPDGAQGSDDTATVRLNPGRSRHDETSYSAAIRAGRKAMANWPKAPAVLSGAILPQYRV